MAGQQPSNSSGSEAQSPIPIEEPGLRRHTSSVARMITPQERQFPWNPKPGTRKPSKPPQSIPDFRPQCESRGCHKPVWNSWAKADPKKRFFCSIRGASTAIQHARAHSAHTARASERASEQGRRGQHGSQCYPDGGDELLGRDGKETSVTPWQPSRPLPVGRRMQATI
jgi:hypothetical protein